MSAPDVLALFAAWTFLTSDEPIPADKFPFAIPNWLSDPVNQDIPFSLLESTLAAWTASTFSGVLPDDVLPVARFLPSPAGVTDGKIAKVVSGAWAIGDDEQETAGGGLGMTLQEGGRTYTNLQVENLWYDTGWTVPPTNFFLQASNSGSRSGLQVINHQILHEGTDAVAGSTAGGNSPTTVIQTVSHPNNTDIEELLQISRTVGGNLVIRAKVSEGDFEDIPVYLRVFEAA